MGRARRQLHLHVQRRARIEPGAEPCGQRPVTSIAGGHRERAVAPDEGAAVAGRGSQRIADAGECDPARELRIPGIRGEDRARPLVESRDDVRGSDPRAADPAPSRCRRQDSGAGPSSCGSSRVSTENFTGLPRRRTPRDRGAIPRCTRENRVTPAAWRMTNRPLASSRRTGPGVGDQNSPDSSSRMNQASAVGIRHRVVRERRQPVLSAVARPGVRGARRGHDRPKAGIRDDVRPRRRRFLVALERDRRTPVRRR